MLLSLAGNSDPINGPDALAPTWSFFDFHRGATRKGIAEPLAADRYPVTRDFYHMRRLQIIEVARPRSQRRRGIPKIGHERHGATKVAKSKFKFVWVGALDRFSAPIAFDHVAYFGNINTNYGCNGNRPAPHFGALVAAFRHPQRWMSLVQNDRRRGQPNLNRRGIGGGRDDHRIHRWRSFTSSCGTKPIARHTS